MLTHRLEKSMGMFEQEVGKLVLIQLLHQELSDIHSTCWYLKAGREIWRGRLNIGRPFKRPLGQF
jgi:hypothetical protein